jgi:hypothetical protein
MQGRNTLGYLHTWTFYTPERKYAYIGQKNKEIKTSIAQTYLKPPSFLPLFKYDILSITVNSFLLDKTH